MCPVSILRKDSSFITNDTLLDFCKKCNGRKINNTVRFPEKKEDLVQIYKVENWKKLNVIEELPKECECTVDC